MSRALPRASAAVAALIVACLLAQLASPSHTPAFGMAELAARGMLRSSDVRVGGVLRRLPTISGGLEFSAREALHYIASDQTTTAIPTSLGCANRTSHGDVRVNQDCTFSRQTDADIAANPTNSLNLVAGQNDASIGWNHCGFDYSLDGGQHWGSGIPPFFERLNHPPTGHSIFRDVGTEHTYDAASDPSVAFDSRGNAYLSCVLFDVNDPAGAILVARSSSTARGSYYGTVPAYSGSGRDRASGVVVEDDTNNATADEEKIASDTFVKSPFRDNLYVVWTEIIASPECTHGGTCTSAIYFSRSSNGAQTFSKPMEISGNSTKLCFDGNLFDGKRKPHDCDLDEGAQPVVLPNGNVVVSFNNSNTKGTNPNNQILAVVSKDGGESWSRPALVGSDVTKGEPQCNLDDGNAAEECVPGPYVRASDDPRLGVDPATGTLFAVWTDYSGGHYSVRISASTDGGRAWTESPNPLDSRWNDAYLPAVGVSDVNHHLAVGYYLSQRVPNETNHKGLFKRGQPGVQSESTVYVLATASAANGPWAIHSVSPTFGPPVGNQSGYNGDYSGITVTGTTAHPIWSDTRNSYSAGNQVFSDEDIFTTTQAIP